MYYTDLNKACPKDFYPLQHIDQLINATSEHEMLSFLDAFSVFYQIRMAPEDEPKTSFITHREIYAYVMMAFGFLYARATYHRMMNKIFSGEIGRNKCRQYESQKLAKAGSHRGPGGVLLKHEEAQHAP